MRNLSADGVDVLAIDAHTYEITDTIEPITFVDKIDGLAVGPGALWAAIGDVRILQRCNITS